MSDAGLMCRTKSTRLDILVLKNTRITDASLFQIGKMTWLDLAGTQLTDEGLAQLNGLVNLQTLTLKTTLHQRCWIVFKGTVDWFRG